LFTELSSADAGAVFSKLNNLGIWPGARPMLPKEELELPSGAIPILREAGLRALTASLMLSYGALKLLPFWDPLRGDPRFEKIVAELAPK
jgi:hypothetical protein